MSLDTATSHLSFDSEHRLRAENLPFDIDVWYPLVASFTFKTEFLPLLKCECQAIQAFYNVSYRHARPHLTQAEISILRNLEASIDNLLDKSFSRQKGAFVRLCGRSPKDGEPLHRSHVLRDYEENLRNLLSEGQEVSLNTKMAAIARTSWLKVQSGAEVLSLLLTSERVYADMLDWERFGEPEQICLRAWEAGVTMDYEFRVFVHDNKIRGVSQYDHYAFYPHLRAHQDDILSAIHALWSDVHRCLGIDSYVFDVAFLPSEKRCVMIELSPFLACTGPALFSWSSPHDMAVLEGREPFEFRLKEESALHPQLEELMEINWDDRWSRGVDGGASYERFLQVSVEDVAAAQEEEDARRLTDTRNMSLRNSVGALLLGGVVLCVTSPNVSPSVVGASLAVAISSVCYFSNALTKPELRYTNDKKTSNHFSLSKEEQQGFFLFVYGTLKRGFQWNKKYLHNRSPELYARFVTEAVTSEKHLLVVGDCGVPYLSVPSDEEREGYHSSEGSDELAHVVGELWEVSHECLRNLDDYEGVGKGYYRRKLISVARASSQVEEATSVQAFVYHLATPAQDLLSQSVTVLPRVMVGGQPHAEYTLQLHQTLYNPIRHIQVKQLGYISNNPSNWGHTLKPSVKINSEAHMCINN